jgi:hypothetical protein
LNGTEPPRCFQRLRLERAREEIAEVGAKHLDLINQAIAHPVRSTMAILSGALVAAYVVLDPTEEAAAHRVADLGQGQLAYAYDVTTIGFTNVWLAMGSFAFACGWVVVSTKAMPVWLGWWGVVAGIAMALAQFVWTAESAWVAPYAAFWLWLLTTCSLLLRRPRSRPAQVHDSPDRKTT